MAAVACKMVQIELPATTRHKVNGLKGRLYVVRLSQQGLTEKYKE
jgi:hypothetical protein